MSDYTPTTEDMREVFVAAVRLSFKDVGASTYSIIRGVTHGGAWFDNWLAEEIRKAKAAARPHIEAEIRARIAAEIRDQIGDEDWPSLEDAGLRLAARIVEGKQ